jgi:hypothetical protein
VPLILAATAAMASGQVTVCDGTGLTIQEGLQGVGGATTQSLVPVAEGGPNLVLNGDFTYDTSGQSYNDGAAPANSHMPAGDEPQNYKAIINWPASGGGSDSYGRWGGETYSGWALAWEPVDRAAGAGSSMIYMGNGNGVGFWNGSITWDANGFAQSPTLYLGNTNPDWYGTFETPVQVSCVLGACALAMGT